MEGEDGQRSQGKVNELSEVIMAGEARYVAERNLNLFLQGINNDNSFKLGQVTE
ncbi:hypothetical protein ACP4OV_006202 [Aristida adscensionis]